MLRHQFSSAVKATEQFLGNLWSLKTGVCLLKEHINEINPNIPLILLQHLYTLWGWTPSPGPLCYNLRKDLMKMSSCSPKRRILTHLRPRRDIYEHRVSRHVLLYFWGPFGSFIGSNWGCSKATLSNSVRFSLESVSAQLELSWIF